jgi:hypothetical protein
MVLRVAIALLLAGNAFGQLTGYGGMWIPSRSVGLTATMGTGTQSIYSAAQSGSILLSMNYYTIIDSLLGGNTIYTRGVGDYFSPDSTGADTTALALDAYVGDSILVVFYFMGSEVDTLLPIMWEQGIHYQPPASDSAIVHTSTVYFNRGFFLTDTLFTDSLYYYDGGSAVVDYTTGDSVADTLFVMDGGTGGGQMTRVWTEWVLIRYPLFRLKVWNAGNSTLLTSDIHVELYCRHNNDLMSGASGRLLQNIERPLTSPRGREGFR